METESRKKINTIGKVGRILSMILFVLTILACAATAAVTVVAVIMPKETINIKLDGTADVSSDGVLFSKLGKFLDLEQDGSAVKLNIAENIDGVSVSVAGDDNILEDSELTVYENGFKINATQKTISVKTGKIIYALAVSLFSFIFSAVTLFMLYKLMKALENCETPFSGEVITSIKRFGYSLIPFVVLRSMNEKAWDSLFSTGFDTGVGIDLTVVIGILVIFLLVVIFNYGAQLQKESDETL